MYKIIMVLAFILLSNFVFAQEQRDFAFYNNETYDLYTAANWSELISIAKESIKKGHDSFYIRMRVGIALYEQKKYTQAIKHFEKGLAYYPENADAKSYLYYCYLFLGRRQTALLYNTDGKENPKFIKSIYFEPGIKLTDNKTSTRDTKYIFIGLNHELGKRVSLFHGYQRLGSNFAFESNSTGNGQGSGMNQQELIYSINQNEYYAGLNFLIGKGLIISPAYHIQGVKSDYSQGQNNVFSTQISKWIGKVKVFGVFYYSEINSLNQQQLEGGLVYYPLGNNHFYLQTQATNHLENSNRNLVWNNRIGGSITSKTWLDISMSYGEMRNFSELNSYVVYNQLDKITSRWGITTSQLLGKHTLYLSYVREYKSEYNTNIPFIHNDIILGFNLTF